MNHLLLEKAIKDLAVKPLGKFSETEEMFKRSGSIGAIALAPYLKGDNEYYADEGDEGFLMEWVEMFDKLEPLAGAVEFTDTVSGCDVNVKCFFGTILVKWINEVGGVSLSVFDIEAYMVL